MTKRAPLKRRSFFDCNIQLKRKGGSGCFPLIIPAKTVLLLLLIGCEIAFMVLKHLLIVADGRFLFGNNGMVSTGFGAVCGYLTITAVGVILRFRRLMRREIATRRIKSGLILSERSLIRLNILLILSDSGAIFRHGRARKGGSAQQGKN
jgi:uncharacterized membrane protein